MIVVIDNYDSFTYNLVQYLGELGARLEVFRNDKITIKGIEKLKPSKIVISPGPCTPREAGISNNVVKHFSGKIPLLGVCLGHQCIGYVFGGNIVRAKKIMHGKVSKIYYRKDPLFKGLSNPFIATRYHSLVIKRETLPSALKIIASTDDEEIMAIKHKKHPTWGVQFHPESILTTCGKKLLKNFLSV
ncbi:MAG: aminodeoxychorismate/anthranilate synthase component II [Candidatus Omnitrophica bacterium]|nr:aminodeoxychorismate/anthranilate synthase component II [Candidatus Omnitrophota bacterium]